MRFKIAEDDEIQCADDAVSALQGWLYAYAIERGGGEYVIEGINIERHDDGWWAFLDSPPRLIREVGDDDHSTD